MGPGDCMMHYDVTLEKTHIFILFLRVTRKMSLFHLLTHQVYLYFVVDFRANLHCFITFLTVKPVNGGYIEVNKQEVSLNLSNYAWQPPKSIKHCRHNQAFHFFNLSFLLPTLPPSLLMHRQCVCVRPLVSESAFNFP